MQAKCLSRKHVRFLSTPSGWRATRKVSTGRSSSISISIHALRVEGDRGPKPHLLSINLFLSTPSGWRATCAGELATGGGTISIHALRVEGDQEAKAADAASRNFYPRPPGGGRPKSQRWACKDCGFLSTPSGWRATRRELGSSALLICHFYPRPPGGGRPAQIVHSARIVVFLSTPSGWRATSK